MNYLVGLYLKNDKTLEKTSLVSTYREVGTKTFVKIKLKTN